MRYLMLMWADADAAGDSIDTAVGWANRLPTYGYVEVRELLQY